MSTNAQPTSLAAGNTALRLGPWTTKPKLSAARFRVFQDPRTNKWYADRINEDFRPSQRARSIYLTPIKDRTKTILPPGGFWFPVAPPVYEISRVSDWNEIKVLGLGAVAHPAGNQLVRLSFASFFPGEWDIDLCLGVPDKSLFLTPQAGKPSSVLYIELLEEIIKNQDLFKLTVNGAPLQITGRITDLTWSEEAGRPDDRAFSITFAGWRPQDIKIRRGARFFEIPRTYKPKKGEDLRDVAMRWYGKESVWRQIAKKNGIKQTPKATIPTKKKTLILPRPNEVK